MDNAGIFYGHLEILRSFGFILWPFGNVAEIWYIFPRFGILCQEKSGNPDPAGAPVKILSISKKVFIPFEVGKLVQLHLIQFCAKDTQITGRACHT
jgi:hypothetical protein